MLSIRTRLSLNFLIVLTLGMLFASAFVWQAVSNLYTDTQRDNLLAQAKLIATALQGQALPQNPQPYSQTMNVMPGVHTRLLTEGGAVVVGLPLSDVTVQMPLAEANASIPSSEMIQRPEIESALQGTPSTAIRRVLGNQRVLYAAAPIFAEDGQILGIVYIATPLPATGLPMSSILQLIGAILLAVLIASFAGRILARQIAKPLEHLANAAQKIAGGDLSPYASVESDVSELDSLGKTFQAMTENLRRSDETKKAFIADVTHELRTPLTVIKGTIETLEDGALDDHEGRGPLLTSMQRETDRLIRLVNELLILTRADAGSLQLDIQPLSFGDLAKQRCEVLSDLAGRQGVNLKVDDETDEHTRVPADSDRLSQVLDNLLENAIRHSPKNSTIIVSIKEAGTRISCTVSDEGDGIPPEHLPFIFERFYRVDKARDRNRGGTGLGLAITRALVQAQGGDISAQSVVGKGTTIQFQLPRTPTSPDVA